MGKVVSIVIVDVIVVHLKLPSLNSFIVGHYFDTCKCSNSHIPNAVTAVPMCHTLSMHNQEMLMPAFLEVLSHDLIAYSCCRQKPQYVCLSLVIMMLVAAHAIYISPLTVQNWRTFNLGDWRLEKEYCNGNKIIKGAEIGVVELKKRWMN